MKKIIIGSLIGGIILFVWSALAWTILPIHLHTLVYTPAQDSILKVLASSNFEDAAYVMPMADNRTISSALDADYMKANEKIMEDAKGKPAATIFYKPHGYNMGLPTALRGLLLDILAVFAACIVLARSFAAMNTFFGRWWLVLLMGFIISIMGPMIQYNWMGHPWNYTMDIVLDNLLNWGITGLWLAWYFRIK